MVCTCRSTGAHAYDEQILWDNFFPEYWQWSGTFWSIHVCYNDDFWRFSILDDFHSPISTLKHGSYYRLLELSLLLPMHEQTLALQQLLFTLRYYFMSDTHKKFKIFMRALKSVGATKPSGQGLLTIIIESLRWIQGWVTSMQVRGNIRTKLQSNIHLVSDMVRCPQVHVTSSILSTRRRCN